MNVTQECFDNIIQQTGSPALNLSSRIAICNALAKWFFVRQEPESDITKRVREYLIELDNTGFVTWRKNNDNI